MIASPKPIRIKDFGPNGLRIAYREGSVDERAVQHWMERLDQPVPDRYELRPDDTILDIGAHIGGFTLLAASLVPQGRVLAVEACRENHDLLVRNVELNGLENVETAHLALSDQRGEIRLHHSASGNWGHTITQALESGSEAVPAETLGGYLSAREVDRCGFAKLNCEGAEFPILMSASGETLRAIRQMLVFYHLDLIGETYSLGDLERHLEEAGFELRRRQRSPVRGRLSARLMG